MFTLPTTETKRKKLPIITGNHRVVLFDEVPILFTGTNDYGGYIVGSSIDEDYDAGKEWYFHSVVTRDEFLNYVRGKVTYRELLAQSECIYVLEKRAGNERPAVYEIEFAEIPESYRPLDSSYYPSYKAEPSLAYETSLIGGIADRGRATPEDAGEAYGAVAQLLKNAVEWLHKEFLIDATVFANPAGVGSFVVNYELSLSSSLFVEENETLRVVNAYLSYLLSRFPDEVVALVQKKHDNLAGFNELFGAAEETLKRIWKDDEKRYAAAKEELARNVCGSALALHSLSKSIGVNYKSFAVSNITSQGEQSLGIADAEYKERIRYAMAIVKESLQEPIEALTSDQYNRTYKIRVYDFNKNSGNGRAYVIDAEEDEEIEPKGDEPWAILHVRNFKRRGGTYHYTQSMHEDSWITVTGKAKRRADKTVAEIEVFE